MKPLEILKHYFGYPAFRDGQEELVEALLSGRDVLGVMPTGAGKSVCYQVPALLLPGVTLVVSPLISLMKDQVTALVQSGVRAAYLNSSLSMGQYRKALDNAHKGVYKIIYVAPERLLTEEFLRFASAEEGGPPVSLVTVDEAHCVSQWGQDFRPGYLQIGEFLRALPSRPPVGAFTATATAEVREDIIRMLELQEPLRVLTGFDRKNLYFEVRHPKDKRLELLEILSKYQKKSGIIYCSTRKNVEEVCALLQEMRFPATRYHAGLSEGERTRNQEDFLYDRKPLMVATNAFGMGIDKSNVSYVIHYNMPKNLEGYYQEAGRAGRDGEDADCILLYSGQDVRINQLLIDRGGNEELEAEVRAVVLEKDRQRLRDMTFYCSTRECLRGYLLRYFGESAPGNCGNCFNCRHNFETLDVTEAARQLLVCVKQTGERYGAKLLIDMLRGSKSERVLRLRLTEQSTYGTLPGLKEGRLREVIHFLVQNEGLSVSEGEYPILLLGKRAGELYRAESLRMKVLTEPKEPAVSSGKASDGKKSAPEELDTELYEILRQLRAKLAGEQGVPPYVIFTNATLTELCLQMPANEEQMLEVAGIGEAKLARYGQSFLAAIAQYRDRVHTIERSKT